MQRPTLLGTGAAEASFAGYTYHLDGNLVPALTVDLAAGQSVYFEHHILLWKSTGVDIGIKAMAGAFKRMMAGMQIFTTEAQGPGQIAFSRDAAGQVFALHIAQGAALHVREHQFLAATGNVDYTSSACAASPTCSSAQRLLHRQVPRRARRRHPLATRLRQRLREDPRARRGDRRRARRVAV